MKIQALTNQHWRPLGRRVLIGTVTHSSAWRANSALVAPASFTLSHPTFAAATDLPDSKSFFFFVYYDIVFTSG